MLVGIQSLLGTHYNSVTKILKLPVGSRYSFLLGLSVTEIFSLLRRVYSLESFYYLLFRPTVFVNMSQLNCSRREKRSMIWLYFTELSEVSAKCNTCKTKLSIQGGIIPRRCCPMEWWKTRALVYPHLVKIAKKHACMMATSVPCERVFSKSGQLLNDRRSRLKAKNVQMVLFCTTTLN